MNAICAWAKALGWAFKYRCYGFGQFEAVWTHPMLPGETVFRRDVDGHFTQCWNAI